MRGEERMMFISGHVVNAKLGDGYEIGNVFGVFVPMVLVGGVEQHADTLGLYRSEFQEELGEMWLEEHDIGFGQLGSGGVPAHIAPAAVAVEILDVEA